MLGDVLETVQDLVDRADRNLTKLFSEPWPPLDTGRQVTYRVAYVTQRTYYNDRSQTRSRSVEPRHTTLRRRIPPISSVGNNKPLTEVKSSRGRPETANNSGPKRRKLIAPSKQRDPPRTPASYSSTTVRPRPSSAPAILVKNKIQSDRLNLVTPVRAETRHTQTFSLDDVRPDIAQCDVLVMAIAEMEICKEMFAGWRAQLNLADPRRNDKLELSIISTVDKLDIGASAALTTSHSLLRSYRTLMQTIERSLREISQSKNGGYLFSDEISSLASNISASSRALSRYVKQMQERLRTLVRDIEKTKESANKRALKRKIWKWLSRAFKVLSALLSVGGAIFALLHPLGLLETTAIAGVSMLSGAVSRLCEVVQDKYNETTFNEVVAFLRDHVPESTKAAEIALTSFQACHRVLQIELEVRKGRQSGWVSAVEAERARGFWVHAEQRLRTPGSQPGQLKERGR